MALIDPFGQSLGFQLPQRHHPTPLCMIASDATMVVMNMMLFVVYEALPPDTISAGLAQKSES